MLISSISDELRRVLVRPHGPKTAHHQSQKDGAHEDEQAQGDAALPLMTSQTGLGGFEPAALLIWSAGGRNTTPLPIRAGLNFYDPLFLAASCTRRKAVRKLRDGHVRERTVATAMP